MASVRIRDGELSKRQETTDEQHNAPERANRAFSKWTIKRARRVIVGVLLLEIRMTNLSAIAATVVAFITMSSETLSQDHASADRSSKEPISVSRFGRDNVIGHLLHPLGTIVRVTGIALDGNTTRRRADEGKTLLKIETVNGETLEQPFTVPFGRAAEQIAHPSHGQRFDFYVHEWGEFDGIVTIPDGLGIDAPMVANDGFYYRPQITIHKSNLPPDSTKAQKSSRTKP